MPHFRQLDSPQTVKKYDIVSPDVSAVMATTSVFRNEAFL
ncbi:hypothetical protein FHX81_6996 [Saccharothrix saharensis]|uniref:Uncharacterized protein n=1 Tax=Saccharothrix saharensis TaxID=571190 RepID=A0A543JNW5_9PSEU|nr:hypothetical protein FHX81_6996 [Saccharothrix saharensis]